MSAVNDEIVKVAEGESVHGWELFDNASQYIYVYRAKNKDDETYKYVSLNILMFLLTISAL